jgi:hypothetical protein
MGWLSRLLPEMGPSFDELRALGRADARKLPKEVARQKIGEHPLLSTPEAAHVRARILACLDGPFDQSARDQCDAMLRDAIAVTKHPVRPGTVEEIWYLEGLLDRFLDP